jgi:tripartite ATP-independent transporter DctM subunit
MGLVELLAVLIALFLLLAVPIAYALILAAVAVILWSGINLMIVPQQVLGAIDSFTLLAVPFFLLAGDLMTMGGMTDRLLRFTNAITGRFRGGLAMSNVLSATLLAGISGSAVADTSALGKVLIPSMIKAGYGRGFAVALTAAANVVGPIIPPSIAFILIGVLANLSITRLFLAGILPGILYSLAMLVVAYAICRHRRYPVHGRASGREVLAATRHAFWALLMPVLIVVGIRSGVFNVTECSAVAVLYALFVGVVIHRELTLARIGAALVATGRATAIIMIVIGGAQIVAWLLAYENVPQELAAAMLAFSREPWVFLILVNVLLILVGTFMENGPAMVMLVPVLFPIAAALGIDPIHFSMIVSVNLIIGLITPPVALCVSIAAIIGRVPMSEASREVTPFLLAAIAVQLLITFVPALSLAIPNLIMGKG